MNGILDIISEGRMIHLNLTGFTNTVHIAGFNKIIRRADATCRCLKVIKQNQSQYMTKSIHR